MAGDETSSSRPSDGATCRSVSWLRSGADLVERGDLAAAHAGLYRHAGGSLYVSECHSHGVGADRWLVGDLAPALSGVGLPAPAGVPPDPQYHLNLDGMGI